METAVRILLWLSIPGGLLVAFVLMIRAIFKNAPSWLNTMLWGLVALRLLIPLTFTVPRSSQHQTVVSSGTADYYEAIEYSGVFSEVYSSVDTALSKVPSDSLTIIYSAIMTVWGLGVIAMTVYGIVCSLKIRKLTKNRMAIRGNVYFCDPVKSPFIAGVIKPRIYLPAEMSAEDVESVISHELAHISARDQWKKAIGFVILALHWFNPLVWIGYSCLCRDIEIYCDRRVVEGKTRDQIADYSEVLLRFGSAPKCSIAGPMSFAELGVKKRIKALLNYNKEIALITYTLAVLCFGVFVFSFFGGGKSIVTVSRTYAGVEPISVTVQSAPTIKVDLSEMTDNEVIFIPDATAEKNGLEPFTYSFGVYSDAKDETDTEPISVTQGSAPALTVTGANGKVNAADIPLVSGYNVGVSLCVNVPSVEVDKEKLYFSFGFEKKPDSVSVRVLTYNPFFGDTTGVGPYVFDDETNVIGYQAYDGAHYYCVTLTYGAASYNYVFAGINNVKAE